VIARLNAGRSSVWHHVSIFDGVRKDDTGRDVAFRRADTACGMSIPAGWMRGQMVGTPSCKLCVWEIQKAIRAAHRVQGEMACWVDPEAAE
jgi:hypothetical protein